MVLFCNYDLTIDALNGISFLPGVFTLILSGVFPSNSADRFTLSKLLAVCLRLVWAESRHKGLLARLGHYLVGILSSPCNTSADLSDLCGSWFFWGFFKLVFFFFWRFAP